MKLAIRYIAGTAGAIALALGCVPVSAQPVQSTVNVESAKGAALPVEQPVSGHPALWKVADEDTTIFLFGTVHALPPGKSWFDDTIARALASSDELVTELDQVGHDSAKIDFASKALLPEGQTLRGLMAPEDLLSYEQAMAQAGLPVAVFDRYEPWYAGLMLSIVPVMRQGYSPDVGVERVLVQNFDPVKSFGALETPEFQVSLFDTMPMEEQLSFLRSAVDSVPDMMEKLNQMVDEWLKGDAEQLATLMNEQEDDPAVMERFLTSRNRTWAGWIDHRLDQPGTVFIAVGAGHLAGPGSVQEQLAKRGIESDRVQ